MSFDPNHLYVQASFRALTDALLPDATKFGFSPQGIDADLGVHEYVITGLNHYVAIQQQLHHTRIPLAHPTATLLDVAAMQLISSHAAVPSQHSPYHGGSTFTYLSRQDRIRALALLENLQIDLNVLPTPYFNNAGLVKHVVDALNRFSMFGFYSEWPAYGSTRPFPPDYRRLESFPLGWYQAGYPGVSLGYRDFRGFLLKMRIGEDAI